MLYFGSLIASSTAMTCIIASGCSPAIAPLMATSSTVASRSFGGSFEMTSSG